jgi:hypothetical protein
VANLPPVSNQQHQWYWLQIYRCAIDTGVVDICGKFASGVVGTVVHLDLRISANF